MEPILNDKKMEKEMKGYYFQDDSYFCPQLQIHDSQEKKAKIENLLSGFRMTKSQVQELRNRFARELEYGLLSNPPRQSLFPMYNTFITNLEFPTGKEVGNFLGMDVGGTNLRMIHLKITQIDDQKFERNVKIDYYDIPNEIRFSNSEKFFNFLASSLKNFVEKQVNLNNENLDPQNILPLGLSFSFDYKQLSINKGKIVQFGSYTNIPDSIGKCPVSLLQKSIDSLTQNIPIKVVALANDCTATLIYSKSLHPQTSISLINGTGTNICYVENVRNYERITEFDEKVVEKLVINSEYCAFDDLDFLRTKYDYKFDGSFVYEKVVVGGAFLGELLRIILIDLIQNDLLLQGHHKVTEELTLESAIQTADLSAIEFDDEFEFGKEVRNSAVVNLLIRLGYPQESISEDDCACVVYAAQLITTRAALFTSSALSIFVDHLKNEQVVKVGCDGSLFHKHPKMSRLINSYVRELCPGRAIEVFDAHQGSGIGVAMIAATVTCHQK